MTTEDSIHSMEARLARLATAVEKATAAQVESAQWCADTQSDIATLMADLRTLSRKVEVFARAFERFTDMLDVRDELKTTSAYPVASGAFDDDIVRMARAGATTVEIARKVGVSPTTIARRRSAIGLKSCSYTHWTRREDDLLRSACAKCSTFGQVAEMVPGRTELACKERAHKLGLGVRVKRKLWTEEEDDLVRENWENLGMSVNDIARTLHRTVGAVQHRARELGCTGRGRKELFNSRNGDRFWGDLTEPVE